MPGWWARFALPTLPLGSLSPHQLIDFAAPVAAAQKRESDMNTKSVMGSVVGALLIASALTPARGADMTNERLLNPQREPQNWILHHGNYQGHRFSQLKEINADSVKNMRL